MRTSKLAAILFILTSIILSMTGCVSKTALTPSGFIGIMEDFHFAVYDITDEKDSSGFANTIISAVGQHYEIEFSELVNDQTGKMIYDYNKDVFMQEHSFQLLSFETSSGDYNAFSFHADGNFHIIARISNTMLYCEAAETYKSEILEIFKALGYN